MKKIIKIVCMSIVLTVVTLSYIGYSTPSENAVLSVDRNQCMGCQKCFYVCPADAIRIISNKAVIDPTKCTKCGNCVETCPVFAIY